MKIQHLLPQSEISVNLAHYQLIYFLILFFCSCAVAVLFGEPRIFGGEFSL